jgi:pantetheine-phosphate adenylyltransferase
VTQFRKALDMERTAVYAGSFDPVTNGHIAILKRGIQMFDKIVVALTDNPSKWHLLTLDERAELLCMARDDYFTLDEIRRIEIVTFRDRLLYPFALGQGACAVLRGLRAVSDFEYEFMMAQTNHALCPGIETVFLMTHGDYSFVSSSMVREVAKLRGDVSKFVPKYVEDMLKRKYHKNAENVAMAPERKP